MSAADVELLRSSFERLADEGYEALLPLIHPEFEMETVPGLAAEPQVYRGPDGVRRWWETFYEVMDDVSLVPIEFHDAGEGRVVIAFRLHARGKLSGAEVGQEAFTVCRVRDRRLARMDFHFTLEEALAAARG